MAKIKVSMYTRPHVAGNNEVVSNILHLYKATNKKYPIGVVTILRQNDATQTQTYFVFFVLLMIAEDNAFSFFWFVPSALRKSLGNIYAQGVG